MILVVGSSVARKECLVAALALSQAHVIRSRLEPGCLSHAVHVDSENPQRLVFVEQWTSPQMLWQHFAVAATRSFAKSLRELSAEPGTLSIYEATPIAPPGT